MKGYHLSGRMKSVNEHGRDVLRLNCKRDDPNFLTPTRSVRDYLREIQRFPLLTPDEERRLIREYQATRDEGIRNRIMMSHQAFIYSAAKNITTDPHLLMELINEANLYFAKAIDKYDPSYDNNLLTYASYYIKCGFYSCLQDRDLVQKKKTNTQASLLDKAICRFCNMNSRYPTNREMIDFMEDEYGMRITEEDLETVDIITLPDTDDEDEEYEEYEDMLGDARELFNERTTTSNGYEDKSDNDYRRSVIDKVLDKLNDRERKIIEMSFGLDGHSGEMGIEEVALRMGLTKEHTWQLKTRALRKMENMMLNGGYGPRNLM